MIGRRVGWGPYDIVNVNVTLAARCCRYKTRSCSPWIFWHIPIQQVGWLVSSLLCYEYLGSRIRDFVCLLEFCFGTLKRDSLLFLLSVILPD